ncbi:GapA-binding peptide SR1P [Alkalihalobacillus sp. CinArs1]|nr:GapA-binding peptide SR1P [Alkalihalobacillus sp. CinArs1]
MGIIICQTCEKTIDHVIEDKVSTLYSRCPECNKKDRK